MAKWVFEPGHTAAEFCVRHMMVTWVRGSFKNIQGTLEFDPEDPSTIRTEVEIDAASIWSGDTGRDDHLRNNDFLDAEKFPKITFRGDESLLLSRNEFQITGDLTLHGVTRRTTLDVRHLGQWGTPFWEDGVDKGPKTRAGFIARTTILRTDFGVSWNASMEQGGVVVGDEVRITLDVEALLQ